MSAQWQIIRTPAGYHVNLLADNNEIILTSEVLTSMQNAENVVTSTEEMLGGVIQLKIEFSDQTL